MQIIHSKICLSFLFLISLLSFSTHAQIINSDSKSATIADFSKQSFFFGIATAPAHIEEGLDDSWLEFAKAGKVAAFYNQPIPEERLRFFTDYKTEIDLAASTGVQVFRMGVDWGRLVPNKPDLSSCGKSGGIQNLEALKRYDEMVDYALSKDMKIMMTLFHHSPPKWFIEAGGWPAHNSDCFVKFSKDVVDHFSSRVSYWITFNEPAVYNMFVYVVGIWPPGFSSPKPAEAISIPGIHKGDFYKACDRMVEAHSALFKYIHKDLGLKTPVGIAHNVAWHKATSTLSEVGAMASRNSMNYHFLDLIIDQVDYIGLNYYGAEYVTTTGLAIKDGVEYSDSGRAIDPYGLYGLLVKLNQRYNVNLTSRKTKNKLPFIITENGVSESGDIIRPAYIVEHLLALKEAMNEGINVLGFIYWTVSDNWEWADGYCPKFGLFSVDRANNLARIPRPHSFSLFKDIATSGVITQDQRDQSWDRVAVAQKTAASRLMCRDADGKTSLDVPVQRLFAKTDWRFNKKNTQKENP